MINLHYCKEVDIVPNPYQPVISFLRIRKDGEVAVRAEPSLHTGNYDPDKKEAGLPKGVWVSIITGAIIDPVCWLDITNLQSSINADFLRSLEQRLTIKYVDLGKAGK